MIFCEDRKFRYEIILVNSVQLTNCKMTFNKGRAEMNLICHYNKQFYNHNMRNEI